MFGTLVGFNDCCWFFGQSSTIGFQADGMFIMEGDEVVAVNGTVCEGQDLEKVSKLVKESEGPSLRSKSFRWHHGSAIMLVLV